MLLTRKKADKELRASADSFSHTAANSHFPCAPTQSWETALDSEQESYHPFLLVFKNG